MVYDIYFHDDFDGVASAAVMADYLRSRGHSIGYLRPVNYLLIPEWNKRDFFRNNSYFSASKNPAVVVDFPFQTEAAWWFDHHPSAFRNKKWEKDFISTPYRRFDTSKKSCCHFVMEALQRDFKYKTPARFKELAKWLDIVDGAAYISAVQTVLAKENAVKLNYCIEYVRRRNGALAKIVSYLSTLSIKRTLKTPEVERIWKEVERKISHSLAYYEKNTKVHGDVAFVDESGIRSVIMRFAPFYFYPKAKYLLRIRAGCGGHHHFSAGFNPWLKKEPPIDLGKMMGRYGGGGHRKVGGLEVKTGQRVKKITEEIVEYLNREG